MRSDWVAVSASGLVVGSLALVLGSALNPATGQDAEAIVATVNDSGGRWLGMAVMFLFASFMLVLGLPAVASLFPARHRAVGFTGVGLFGVGAICTSGYAAMMIFMRALVDNDALRADRLSGASHEVGLSVMLYSWIGCFYLGVLLIAIGLFRTRATPRWVPVVLFVFVASLPLGSIPTPQTLKTLTSVVQVMVLTLAFTGIAVTAVSDEHRRALARGSFL